MENLFTVLCTGSAVDVDTNSVSLFNLVERLTLPAPPPQSDQIPFVPLPLTIVGEWIRTKSEPNEAQLNVQILDPSGQPLLKDQPPITFSFQSHLRARARVNLPGFPIRGEGDYQIVLEIMVEEKELLKHSIPVEVVYASPGI
jgi:hypothetical protein